MEWGSGGVSVEFHWPVITRRVTMINVTRVAAQPLVVGGATAAAS